MKPRPHRIASQRCLAPTRVAVMVLAIMGASVPWSARAELGGSPEAFAQDPMLAASRISEQRADYSMRTTVLTTGTQVRECTSPDGLVFALAWQGPFMPDLKILLGVHFDTLTTQAGTQARAGRPGLAVSRPEVVIQSSGRMRAFQGRAWIPARLPPGFDTHELD